MSTSKRRRKINPKEYIVNICELQLQAKIDPSYNHIIDIFVSGKIVTATTNTPPSTTITTSNNDHKKEDDDEDNNTNTNTATKASSHLFIWIPKKKKEKEEELSVTDNDEDWNVAYASIESYDIHNNLGALAFINSSCNSSDSSNQPIRSIGQIHCITLSPLVVTTASIDEQVDSESSDRNDLSSSTTPSSTNDNGNDNSENNEGSTALFCSLQMYTRFAFLPSIKAMELEEDHNANTNNSTSTTTSTASNTTLPSAFQESSNIKSSSTKKRIYQGLQEKIRDLDITLGQCRRYSTFHQIPHVTLIAHPLLFKTCNNEQKKGNIEELSTLLCSDDTDRGGLLLLQNDKVLNEIQSGVTTWIQSISRVTILTSTTPFPSIIEDSNNTNTILSSTSDQNSQTSSEFNEISFWISLEDEISHITKNEFQKVEIQLSLEILKRAKRFLPLKALETNTNLYISQEKVRDITSFLRLYPIQKLAQACDFYEIQEACDGIFDYLPKIRLSRYYDLDRCLLLVCATTLTLRNRMVYILLQLQINMQQHHQSSSSLSMNIMTIPYTQYMKLMHQPTQDIFNSISEKLQKFLSFLLETCRKRSGSSSDHHESSSTTTNNTEKSMNITWKNTIFYHVALKERLDEIYNIRNQLENLHVVVSEVVLNQSQSDQQEEQKKKGVMEGYSTPREANITTTNHVELGSSIISTSLVTNITKRMFSSSSSLTILFDVSSPNGKTTFHQIMITIQTQISKVENTLGTILRQRLSTATSAEHMFFIFQTFHPLLSRPRISSEVKDFQLPLVKKVRMDITKLLDKFTISSYNESSSSSHTFTTKYKHLPPIASKILWAKVMERQIQTLLQQMNVFLGKDRNFEARTAQQECEDLLHKLNPRNFVLSWVNLWKDELFSNERLTSYVLLVKNVNNKDDDGVVVEDDKVYHYLQVNFTSFQKVIVQEIQYLLWLGYEKDIPDSLFAYKDIMKKKYPLAMMIQTTLRSYQSFRLSLLGESSSLSWDLQPLLAPQIQSIRDCLEEVFELNKLHNRSNMKRITWDIESSNIGDTTATTTTQQSTSSYQILNHWVRRLTKQVQIFEKRVDALLRIHNIFLHTSLNQLQQCEYKSQDFLDVLQNIQKCIDELNLAGYANLEIYYMRRMNENIENVMIKRLEESLLYWTKNLSMQENNEVIVSIDIVLRQAEISSVPTLPLTRSLLHQSLNNYIQIVCNLPRPIHGKFEVFDSSSSSREEEQQGQTKTTTYSNLLYRINPTILVQAYSTIEKYMHELSTFLQEWFQYQIVFDTQLSDVIQHVGDDSQTWLSLLSSTQQARSALEETQTNRRFGPVLVEYYKIQSQISLKYDNWLRDLQVSFASFLQENIVTLHDDIVTAKNKLEMVVLDETSSSSSTIDMISGVTYLQTIREIHPRWGEQVIIFLDCERFLKKQRFVLDEKQQWMEANRPFGQYQLLEQLFTKKNLVMQKQLSQLQQRILSEEKNLESKQGNVMIRWQDEKPLRGTFIPKDALNVLYQLEGIMKQILQEHQNISSAKVGLELPPSNTSMSDTTTQALQRCLQEMEELKVVWNAISTPHDKLYSLKVMLWKDCQQPRKIKQILEDLLSDLRSLPNAIRQYDAYCSFSDMIKSYISSYKIWKDLKSEALKERHWKRIFQTCFQQLDRQNKNNLSYDNLTLGAIWDINLSLHKKSLLDILTVAHGEQSLSLFLSQIRDKWNAQELSFVIYPHRNHTNVKILSNFNVLFHDMEDHMTSLTTMSSSPYFYLSEFQEERTLWLDRLSKLKTILDLWLDVQRRWIYLEGIFLSSVDIQAQLPSEYQKFRSCHAEFTSFLRKFYPRPYVMEVLQMENGLRLLERLSSTLTTLQKSLSKFLEQQRTDFARFYFLGDDDLLEMIGGGGDPNQVLQHIGKMFAGLANAKVVQQEDDKGCYLESMTSKDGEIVAFNKPIEVQKKSMAKEWLRKLELEMYDTLSSLLNQIMTSNHPFFINEGVHSNKEDNSILQFIQSFPCQVILLSIMINWCTNVDSALSSQSSSSSLEQLLQYINSKLVLFTQTILLDLPYQTRKKIEHVITEFVHQRDVTRALLEQCVSSPHDFRWLYHLRFRYTTSPSMTKALLSYSSFDYGYEYLGMNERLVQTPLTDRCYLTLTQALFFRLGGNPFGPAGTGKTESVKALGGQLGRFVVVMNCDETFDFNAMGRLFCGLCQVGAWGCFDEFNRLEERILSAVSQQILTIQHGLLQRRSTIEILGKQITLHDNVGIFVTMNPGYAGRSNLPDNLKSLFRSVAMVVPDRKLIAQVMLYSQGFVSAEDLASKVVELFIKCEERLSKQSHYDFGLRALKTLLVSAGGLKRRALLEYENREGKENSDAISKVEAKVLIQGACHNIVPKIVAEDVHVFQEILKSAFPGSALADMKDEKLYKEIIILCNEKYSYIPEDAWVQKIFQLKSVLEFRHGVMLVGPIGTGKSSALHVLCEALERVDETKRRIYFMDPKVISKENLYGSLDSTTLEWTDGVFTSKLRQIIANQKGESEEKHWIVLDGDVDPEWAENLNSVLDDNKILTLPSGERLNIPDNLRIILEVNHLHHATPATVSRCGMVWFSPNTVSVNMYLQHFLLSLRRRSFGTNDVIVSGSGPSAAQVAFLDAIEPMFTSRDDNGGSNSSLVSDALEFSLSQVHIMLPIRERLFVTLKSFLIRGIQLIIEYNETHFDIPMSSDHLHNFSQRWVLFSLLWSFGGSASWNVREELSCRLRNACCNVNLCPDDINLCDYRVRVNDGEWERYSNHVPRIDIESHKVTASDLIITTTDTLRHSDILDIWFSSRSPVILCGPPGSGKTMTLISVLQNMQGVVLANLNFSSRTTPEVIFKTLAQYCSYVRRGKDIVMEPIESLGADIWLVVFCDEINLPEQDSYGTQRVTMLMRQLVEKGGFWRTSDNTWVKIDRIQFVGACNPNTDTGRVEMSPRFLRHSPLLLVDSPSHDSLIQIYRTLNGGIMKLLPNLRGETDAMTEAMVEVYERISAQFTPDMQPQYYFSARELSRWVRGIYEAVADQDNIIGLTSATSGPLSFSREDLVRVWAHEALRLFCDRLVETSEQEACKDIIDDVAVKWFANVNHDKALSRPILFSSWLSKVHKSVKKDELRDFLSARLKSFYEEELDVPLVLFEEVLDHVLRIDRVLRQPMGHCLLVGDSGVGKTVLSKFVSWMNGLSIFQIKAHTRYSLEDFNADLRSLMYRVGVDGEKICFIFDEANALNSGFLEAMNALLASGEVPGLFEGEELTKLTNSFREANAAKVDSIMLDSDEELWRHFTKVIQLNLHVVFTMNPSGGDWKNRSTTSPALFNRCVVNWFGSWSNNAMAEISKHFTNTLDMGDAEAVGGSWGIGDGEILMHTVESAFKGIPGYGLRQAVVAALVEMHNTTKVIAQNVASNSSTTCKTFISPRDFLVLNQNFTSCLNELRAKLEEEQLHVNAGLEKLRETRENVAELRTGLAQKSQELKKKEKLANLKLQQMVVDQNEAEHRKEVAERMSKEAKKQQVAIKVRKEEAQKELEEAEPALHSAQASVRSIKKKDLDEVRSLPKPPNNVKLTLEILAIMMGETKLEWMEVRKMLSKSDFIPNILNFDVDHLSARQIRTVKEKYLNGNEITYESVMRSSKACGPLFKWANSQIIYSEVFNRVLPLREEVNQLEVEAKHAEKERVRIEEEVVNLESSIFQYKADYALLIRDVEALKSEMGSVTIKIDRAESLIHSLSHENDRWTKSSEGFQSILSNIVGDSILMAAFLTYFGFFDFQTRSDLIRKWRNILDIVGISYREELSLVDSLSKSSQQLHWQKLGLPPDALSLENGVILERCIRFPLIIDPSGYAIDFVLNKYRDKKIQKTSFLDRSFMKTLSNAVRFGTTLLIENVETIDPVLNPILNREIQRTGGRMLITIGSEDIDYSSAFHIILTTKDPAAKFSPDLCSRVTLINFITTPASLQNQSRSLILKHEQPKMELQRKNVLKLQGEHNVKLRDLEENMLATINAAKGSILDNDDIVSGMEKLMKDGAEVSIQIEKSADTINEVQRAISKYEPLSELCKKIFVLFNAMRNIHYLYELSASSFMKILEYVLENTGVGSNNNTKSIDDERFLILSQNILNEVIARVSRGLLSEDKMVFALMLQIVSSNNKSKLIEEISGAVDLQHITSIIENHFEPSLWQDRGLSSLKKIIIDEIDASTPLMLCSAPGHDFSGRVEALAKEEGKDLLTVAMGSAEGFVTAEKYITSASKRGAIVMMRNCHLCTEWLKEVLVKKLQSLSVNSTHPDFRIVMTSEISPKLPAGLLRLSDVVIAEGPSGVKATLYRFISSISRERFKNPIRNRLYLILGWVHAVIQERLRYVPLGWSDSYDFSEADAIHALDVIDFLIEKSISSLDKMQQKSALATDPENLPWVAIRTSLCKGIFGGRVTKHKDQLILEDLIHSIFKCECFNIDFKLGKSAAPVLPESTSTLSDCLDWIDSLSPYTPPTWIGLDGSAEAIRASKIAKSVMEKVKCLTEIISLKE